MKLSHIRIRNYRSLRDFSAHLNRFTVILGENDVGKTTVLYALDTFFNGKKLSKPTDFFNLNTKLPVEIELTFVSTEPPTQLIPFVNNDGEITVRRVFPFDKEPQYFFLSLDREFVDGTKKDIALLVDEEKFHFIPVRRSIEDQFSMGKTALLGKTFRALMKSRLAESNAAASQQEVSDILASSLDPARAQLQTLLRDQMNNDSLLLRFPNLSIDPIAGVSFDVTIGDDKIEDIPLMQRGAGTQNCMILALYRFIASTITSDFVLALEEPENSFHPKGQRELLAALDRLSQSCQVICTTHSPVFIDRVDFRTNVILVRHPDGATSAKTVNADKLSEIREILGIRPSDALLKGGGNFAVIAEGKSEEQAFPRMMHLCGMSDRKLGISVLPLHGYARSKVADYVKLLAAYDLQCGVVLDQDVSEQDITELRNLIGNGYPTLRFVHHLKRGSLEDYYPVTLLKKGIAQHLDGRIDSSRIETFPALSGKSRLNAIKKHLFEVHNLPIRSDDFLKMNLAQWVPDWMSEFGESLDDELYELFKRAEELAKL